MSFVLPDALAGTWEQQRFTGAEQRRQDSVSKDQIQARAMQGGEIQQVAQHESQKDHDHDGEVEHQHTAKAQQYGTEEKAATQYSPVDEQVIDRIATFLRRVRNVSVFFESVQESPLSRSNGCILLLTQGTVVLKDSVKAYLWGRVSDAVLDACFEELKNRGVFKLEKRTRGPRGPLPAAYYYVKKANPPEPTTLQQHPRDTLYASRFSLLY